ncbi:MAG: hypothetical protein ACOC97_04255 [Myxococcota bacterium]
MKLAIFSAVFAFTLGVGGAPVAGACPGGDDRKDPSALSCPGDEGDKDRSFCPGDEGDKDRSFCPGDEGDKDRS